MKSKYIIPILFFVVLSIGCGVNQIRFQVLKPAEVSLPQHIKTIVILNRYRPTKENVLGNILEAFLSGEKPLQDKQGAENAITGLTNFITQTPRFKVIRATEELYGTGNSWFPAPLSSQEIINLCQKYQADGLVILEAFDHDKRSSSGLEQRSKTENGQLLNYNVWVTKHTMNVTSGWRVYDGSTAKLIDEYRMPGTYTWQNEGATKELSMGNFPDDYYMVRNVGYTAGSNYANRISPQWEWVARNYYKKGNEGMKSADYKVRAGQWDDAINIWKMQLNDPSKKIQGRSSYNIAVAYEQLGDLNNALEWAKKSLGTYQFKDAEQYIFVIENRISEEKALKHQLNSEVIDSLKNLKK